jgi:hypothetical protein
MADLDRRAYRHPFDKPAERIGQKRVMGDADVTTSAARSASRRDALRRD